ncbi:TonB-dependent receptor [Bacteroides thetaiotaomicron]|uniref:TonB-dependent receptor n=1 Tax=Bacteroides thetaiotaomicron TaxID=818 RepID=UPI002165E152|nr:TonB-dependent receptor [Bacteroides thetaiotaomicron]MCS2714395.1 TonB-dependent receptor [Bacteroides thetaiotaomicron]MCS2874633.1 TonB-dependent receptor [Bacteroides thetaiotaomicron]
MKKLYILTLFICLAGFGTSFAQTLKGHIYDANTNEPLVGAAVTYKLHGNQGTVSDINGAYEIKLPEGGVDLVFSYIGYEDVLMPIVIGKREVITKDVYMKESTKLLEEVVVSAGRFEQKLSNVTVSMDLVKAGDIARQAPTDITSTLRTLPGVDIVDKQPSMRGGSGWTYGVGARSQILVDGMSTLNPKTGEINWNTVPLENIEQIEVIKGASSVLYGSSALNGIINIRTARPGLTPKTRFSAYIGIYGDAENDEYQWSDKSFWKDDKYSVKPILRGNLLSGIRNPIYEGFDLSHSRRIGNFDVSGSINLFTDEGYRQQGYNKRFRMGGNLTYHQPDMGMKVLNYGLNVDFLSNQYGDFFIWRSPTEVYKPSPFTNMGREENNFHIDPFINYVNPENGTSHKIKGRFYHSADNIVKPSQGASITDILGNMGTNAQTIQNITGGDYSSLYPALVGIGSGLINNNLEDAMNGVFTSLGNIFPNATTADYCDLISWVMDNGLPSDLMSSIQNGQVPSDLIPWLSNVMNPTRNNVQTKTDKNYNYYLDYQFNKKWDGGAQITTGMTYEHVRYNSSIMDQVYKSDNVAAFFQYDQRFWDRLSVSAGVRAEYYRVNNHHREAETKIFGAKVPFRPVFRTGLNYQLADYSFIRASAGQGYRNPSINEKYLRKDIGGVGIYPNLGIKPEKGYNAELGFKQGYKIGNFQGFVDVAGFYTEYRDMVEFQFGLFNNADYSMINSISDAIQMLTDGKGFGIGAQFHNVSKAQIYGMEISTNGVYDFNKNTKLFYNLGYVYTEPRDADYKERNEIEDLYTDALQMKEKSNTGKYLKYRPKHSFKATVDFQWKRINLGANFAWKSKILAVDYLMMDEREKQQQDLMDYVRTVLFGKSRGETLATYWKKHNTDYATVDLRFGVKATKEVAFQFMVNNLLNKEYSYRPMAVAAPRTFVVKMDITF